jgi:PKD repeat protein
VHDFFNVGLDDTTFTVNLISYSPFGCVDSSRHRVTVYPDPVAAFSILPLKQDYPSATENIVNETNKGNWNYLWNFGDNSTESVKDPESHTYSTWGTYIVKLNVRINNCSDSASASITIVPPVPVAGFTMTSNVCLGLPITFTDQSVWATSWLWNFGDSTTYADENPPPHIYRHSGLFHVQLNVSGDGGFDVIKQDVQVYPLPVVKFTPVPTLALLPDAKIRFYNSSQLGVRYLWDFGDNQKSVDMEPTHTYLDSGKYTVTLYVWTENNCIDSTVIADADTVIEGGEIKFPNVFTPDPNGSGGGFYTIKPPDRTVFHPYWKDVTEYDLEVYDRWGEKLFQTNNIAVGWDGYYKGKICKGDVYIWIAKGKFTNGQSFDIAGSVTLLR